MQICEPSIAPITLGRLNTCSKPSNIRKISSFLCMSILWKAFFTILSTNTDNSLLTVACGNKHKIFAAVLITAQCQRL